MSSERNSTVVIGIIVATMIATLSGGAAWAQESPAPEGKEEEGCRVETVPLEVKAGIALAEISVNGKPRTFMVDSAGTTMINTERLKLPVTAQLQSGVVTVSQMLHQESWDVVEIDSLRVGGEELRHLRALSRSLPQVENQLGRNVDGILGADLLTRWDEVQLDYKHGKMRLGHAKCATESKDGHTKLEAKDRKSSKPVAGRWYGNEFSESARWGSDH